MRLNIRRWIGASVSLAVLSLLVVQFVEQRSIAERWMGYYLEEGDGRLIVAEVLNGDPAERAGLEDGDVLRSVAGHSVGTTSEYDLAASFFPPGRTVTFGVEREGREFALEVRPGVPFDWPAYLLNARFVELLGSKELKFEAGKVTGINQNWTIVDLTNTYTKPVVITTVNLTSYSNTPLITRVRNAGATSFEVRVQVPRRIRLPMAGRSNRQGRDHGPTGTPA